VFSATQVELFKQKSAREGEFERVLKPPVALVATAKRDGIEVTWEAPPDLAEVAASLADQPLLRLGFRVYRWREGEQPRLLATLEGLGTTYEDRDLPLWRERFFYCVATVIEGTIGEVPTLIESRQSPVKTADTLENFTITVEGGSEESVRLDVAGWVSGGWRHASVELAKGGRVAGTAKAPPRDAPNARPESFVDAPVDTGLTLEQAEFVDGQYETTVQRPEFLPDGRRKLDPTSGQPTFRAERVSVPTRTLVVTLADAAGAQRTISSPVKR
jgi:hypothetical protein